MEKPCNLENSLSPVSGSACFFYPCSHELHFFFNCRSWYYYSSTLFNIFIKSCSSSLVSFNDNGFSLRCTCLLGVDAPVTQSAFTYFSLALVYGGVLLYRRQRLRVIIHFFDYLAYEVINKTYRLGGSNLDRY